MSTERTPKSDKELWQSLATARDVAPAAVSEIEFAAWLEGRLPAAETARIDVAVAADPEMRRAALDLADILGKPLPAAPARMVVRAQALVGFEAEREAGLGGFLSRLFIPGMRDGGTHYGLQRAAMATAAVLLAVGGFSVGGGLGESFAQERYGVSVTASQTTTAAASDSSNEMSEFFASDGI